MDSSCFKYLSENNQRSPCNKHSPTDQEAERPALFAGMSFIGSQRQVKFIDRSGKFDFSISKIAGFSLFNKVTCNFRVILLNYFHFSDSF
jgi:hypothetical protein